MAVVFQKISKMKAGFGNLLEICGEMIEKRVVFQKISKKKVGYGNLVEIRLEKCFSRSVLQKDGEACVDL